MNPLHTVEGPSPSDRAVSPVIGVILMVAVTVVLGAVVGTFVLDLGQGVGTAGPSASLRVAASPATNNVTISHAGGDGLADARTRIVLVNETDGLRLAFAPGSSGDVLSVGEQVVVNTTAPGGGAATIGASADAFVGRTAGGGAHFEGGLKRGMRYTVQVVDTRGRRLVYETTLRA